MSSLDPYARPGYVQWLKRGEKLFGRPKMSDIEEMTLMTLMSAKEKGAAWLVDEKNKKKAKYSHQLVRYERICQRIAGIEKATALINPDDDGSQGALL